MLLRPSVKAFTEISVGVLLGAGVIGAIALAIWDIWIYR